MRDTTQPQRELEATREQLRNLIERNGDAIVVVDDAGLVQFANPAAESLFGYTADELLGLTIYDLIAEDRESIELNIHRTLANGHHAVGPRARCWPPRASR